jgi:plasmid maintenance system antidote protein VapI
MYVHNFYLRKSVLNVQKNFPFFGNAILETHSHSAPMKNIWLQQRLKEIGKQKRALANHLGLSPARITEIIAGQREIKAREIPKVAAFLGMSIEDTVNKLSDKFTPTDSSAENTTTIWVKDFVRAGHFSENHELSESQWTKLVMPNLPYRELHGIRVVGRSMDKIYPDGSIVFMVPVWMLEDRPIQIGDHLVVERRQHGEAERTIKTLRQDSDGRFWLWPESTDPEHQEPIRIDHKDQLFDDGGADGIFALGIIVGSIGLKPL